jgi:hypothetical protein
MQDNRNAIVGRRRTAHPVISRRLALGSYGVTALGLLSRSVPGQTQEKEADTKKPTV